jgi:hypothetical protein
MWNRIHHRGRGKKSVSWALNQQMSATCLNTMVVYLSRRQTISMVQQNFTSIRSLLWLPKRNSFVVFSRRLKRKYDNSPSLTHSSWVHLHRSVLRDWPRFSYIPHSPSNHAANLASIFSSICLHSLVFQVRGHQSEHSISVLVSSFVK